MIQQAIKKIIRTFGYEAHRSGYCTDPNNLRMGSGNIFPYIQLYKFDGYSFNFWVVNKDILKEYNPEDCKKDAEITELINLVKPGDRVLEIGSHHGFYTMLLSLLVGQKGLVVAVEPQPANSLVLHSQVTLNNVENICKVKNLAMSDKSGTVRLTKTSSNASVLEHDVKNTMSIKADKADNLLTEFGHFDVIKLDVEGYEAKVLSGCKKILESKPKLAIELHVPFLKNYNTNTEEIFRLIGVQNYEGTMIFRKDKSKSYPFKVNSINNDVINLFLQPKHHI